MAMQLLMLDTSIVIHYFKGHAGVVPRLLACTPASVAVSAIVAYELQVGVEKSARRAERLAQLQSFLQTVAVYPFGDQEAHVAARIRAGLEAAGQAIGPLDTLIAAAAMARGAVLVTNNAREFGRVPGLQLADWV